MDIHPNLPAEVTFKVNNENTRKVCEICSGVFIANFKFVSYLFLLLQLLTLNK